MNGSSPAVSKARTGIPGLDDILYGGLTRGELFLTEGNPGAGKTTLGLQFILEGAKAGEKGLYITLTETEQELRKVVARCLSRANIGSDANWRTLAGC